MFIVKLACWLFWADPSPFLMIIDAPQGLFIPATHTGIRNLPNECGCVSAMSVDRGAGPSDPRHARGRPGLRAHDIPPS
ncbi:hypothetical protein UPYG_G00008620 [Umbra pygmaea]|uniref:Uncharacterized protein n=1 Tax=Umbra pygmaea TaxID=75934 RepID=A0ABD0XI08_UMBPY